MNYSGTKSTSFVHLALICYGRSKFQKRYACEMFLTLTERGPLL